MKIRFVKVACLALTVAISTFMMSGCNSNLHQVEQMVTATVIEKSYIPGETTYVKKHDIIGGITLLIPKVKAEEYRMTLSYGEITESKVVSMTIYNSADVGDQISVLLVQEINARGVVKEETLELVY